MAGDIHFCGERRGRALFEDRARRLAADMRASGVAPDDTVAVLMRNDFAMLEVIEACRYAGARFVTLNWHAARPEIEHILADSGAKALYAHGDLAATHDLQATKSLRLVVAHPSDGVKVAYGLSAEAPRRGETLEELISSAEPMAGSAEALRGIFAYTSGSTGRPKGVARTAPPGGGDRYEVFRMLASRFLQMQSGDRMHISAPLYHSAPNTLSQFVLAAGDLDLFIEPKFDAEAFLRDIERHRITHAYLVPVMMVRLLKLPQSVRDRYDVSSLRYTVSTGSPCPADVKEAMIDWFGPVIHESYGASEIGFMTLIGAEEALAKPGSVGKILPGGEVKILDDELKPLPAGEVGSIYVRLPMFGEFSYTNDEGGLSSQKVDGFATVGDMGYVDEDGCIFICDRKKDMIISGGANIFPAEIEAALIQMPEIADCAVFGAPDSEFGEKIVAAVQVNPGASCSADDVKAFLGPRLAAMKIPKEIDFHDALPREDSGKIFKARLRDPYWRDAGRRI